jgi:hypothetical protein
MRPIRLPTDVKGASGHAQLADMGPIDLRLLAWETLDA